MKYIYSIIIALVLVFNTVSYVSADDGMGNGGSLQRIVSIENKILTRKVEHYYYSLARQAWNFRPFFSIKAEDYKEYFSDGFLDEAERKLLYTNYYSEMPKSFTCSATLYGSDIGAMREVLSYGEWIRQQMSRGWVLIGSRNYGYHDSLEKDLSLFIQTNYSYKDDSDVLLSKQASPLYLYFADGGRQKVRRDIKNQPVPVIYSELNSRQKRIYDFTSVGTDIARHRFISTIDYQQSTGIIESLNSGKYIGIISSKSPNDFGRRFILFLNRNNRIEFLGIVLVGGEAKRDDWVGFGSPTSKYFKQFPLGLRNSDGLYWGADIPVSIYEYIKGCDVNDEDFCYGPALNLIFIDPDLE